MANNQDQKDSTWQSNKELNIQGNTSVTNDVMNDDPETESPDSSWRPTEEGWEGTSSSKAASHSPSQASGVNIHQSETRNSTGDPGRTPGKAEGEEDFQKHGNE